MGFFDVPSLPEPEPYERPVLPPWAGAPEDVLPACVALDLVLVRSETHVVCVTHVLVYPAGFEFDLLTFSRSEDDYEPWDWEPPLRHRRVADEQAAERLRFGVEFSDGRKATTLGASREALRSKSEPEIVLAPSGGSWGGRRSQHSLWVWPLPPPGPLAFVCEWTAARIALTRREIDSAQLRDAAARCAVFWSPAETRDAQS